ncbi:farnesyl-diphosphate synthase [Endomicrobiia bacterium]|nr:farnesyl-diphosphate synthase [Endomicrobiia bacterium]GHT11735.1 farnesyl-diphosphate synthase [Endomicrobiia bacterium]GHT19821.1 farnesyl-diphosphate synthase [Endomicrobiia bacterium]GHT26684.1 farnesyl-diphosphate synthase [Endomicrobiia bacterium]GHT29551.1 farnesyl-diphosphate synthase [Endomicrobiia bacterium]
MKNIDFKKYILQKVEYINLVLKKFLPKDNSVVSQGMRYSVLAGGKRLRPVLVILAAELFGVKAENVIPAACAIEYLHTYSLIHDDLPAMDNDDLRRGISANHKKFGEAAAILCGDALLTESFSLITKSKSSEKNINEAVRILAYYGGYKGMIAGQAEDILETGKWSKKNKILLGEKIKFIQIQKTAALMIASLKIGAVLAGADKEGLKALEVYGKNAGIAFQIVDDILDVYADKKLMGKEGSDAENGKLTVLSLCGKREAEKKAYEHIKKAKKAVSVFGNKSEIFVYLVDYIADRTY